LAALNVDAIFAWNLLPALAAKNATDSIPIILGAGNDPVGTGLVASLAHPGGNVTGLSAFSPTLMTKRLELRKEAAPGTSRLAVPAYAAGATTNHDWSEVQAAGSAFGLGVRRYNVAVPEDLDRAFAAMAADGADALINLPEQFFTRSRQRLGGPRGTPAPAGDL
jgi:putative ABC transport system substrate-binding protein